jgi:hypothetical protein
MIMYCVSISMAIPSSAPYHFSRNATPPVLNPPLGLLVTCALAMVLIAGMLYFLPGRYGVAPELRRLHWASILLAVSIIALGVRFMLVHRSGWNIDLAAVFANFVASLILVPIALLVPKHRLSASTSQVCRRALQV